MSEAARNPNSPQDPIELAELYVAGALTSEERARFEQRVLAGDAAYIEALSMVMPALENLANLAVPVAPPKNIKLQLLSRLDQDAAASAEQRAEELAMGPEFETVFESSHEHEHSETRSRAFAGSDSGVALLLASDAKWKPTGLRGVSFRPLCADRRANRRTFLLKMDPGTQLPDHGHTGVEEVFVLSGDLNLGTKALGPGDYFRTQPGCEHAPTGTTNGCVCLIVCSYVPFTTGSLWSYLKFALRSLFGKHG